MKGNIIRKIFVVLIIIAPVVSYSGCKKQAKCGCDGDVLFSLSLTQAKVSYTEGGKTIIFSTLADPYSTYTFCNPGEMWPKFTDYKSGDVLLVSGNVFWDCTYLSQSSNYGYSTPYKSYQVQVSDVTVNLYGKK